MTGIYVAGAEVALLDAHPELMGAQAAAKLYRANKRIGIHEGSSRK
jgi:hypothetical protein